MPPTQPPRSSSPRTCLRRGVVTPVNLPAAALYQLLAEAVVRLAGHAVMLDGLSSANPYRVVTAAKARGLDARMVADRVIVARGFTPHQLAALATEELPRLVADLKESGSELRLVWLNGLALMNSSDLLAGEGKALRAKVMAALRRCAGSGRTFVVVTEGEPARHGGDPGPARHWVDFDFEFKTEMITMGRSTPSYRVQLEHMLARWGKYRQVLSPGEQPIFDRLMTRARTHAAEGAFLGSVDPLEPVLLGILLEQEKQLLSHAQGALPKDG